MTVTKSKSHNAVANGKNGGAAVGSKVVSADQAAADISMRLFGGVPGLAASAANGAGSDVRSKKWPTPNQYGVYSDRDCQHIRISMPKSHRSKALIHVIQVGENDWRTGINLEMGLSGTSWSPSDSKHHERFATRAEAIIDAVRGMIKTCESDVKRNAEHAKHAKKVKPILEKWLANFKRDNEKVDSHRAAPTKDAEPNAIGQAMSGRWYVDAKHVDRNPFQPRKEFDQEGLHNLAENIKQVGRLIEPIKVRPHPDEPGRWQLIDGERRLRATRILMHDKIAAERIDASDQEMMMYALATFDHKAPLNPIEHAEALALAAKAVKEGGLGIAVKKLALQLGCSDGHIRNTIRIADLPEPWRSRCASREMSARHARGMLAAIDKPKALERLEEIWQEEIHGGVTPNAAAWENMVDSVLVEVGAASRKRPKPVVDRPTPPAASSPAASPSTPRQDPAPQMMADRRPNGSTGQLSKETREKFGQGATSKPAIAAADAEAARSHPDDTRGLREAIAARLKENRQADEGVLEAIVLFLLGRADRVLGCNMMHVLGERCHVDRGEEFATAIRRLGIVDVLDDYREILADAIAATMLKGEHILYFKADTLDWCSELLGIKLAQKPKVANPTKKGGANKPAKKAARASSKTATRAAKKKGGGR